MQLILDIFIIWFVLVIWYIRWVNDLLLIKTGDDATIFNQIYVFMINIVFFCFWKLPWQLVCVFSQNTSGGRRCWLGLGLIGLWRILTFGSRFEARAEVHYYIFKLFIKCLKKTPQLNSLHHCKITIRSNITRSKKSFFENRPTRNFSRWSLIFT